jgi:hypothetical protein
MATQTCTICGGGLGGPTTSDIDYDDEFQECCIYDQEQGCGKIILSGQCCVEGMAWRSGKEDYEFCGDDCVNGDQKDGDPCCNLTTYKSDSEQCCPGDVVIDKSAQCPGISGDPHVVPFHGDPYDL